ncbi:HPF/RaiA family ribosome-associated protein [Nocardia mexicana]|uniref:Sigma 54 modulation/S30EA-like ribosomal protein n=1 Tax=Nocardia mexicana TaxID=279262 RepID=A0A370HCC4_9NOCA|nr:HPF/RaiA family ribosome-associated protein [Nocardia mexicana]RDI54588.1 hypothetical protein DFR68_102716 [Nocardia mexicana]
MQIQVNTDSTITGSADLVQQAEATIGTHLERFADQLTRVEVHLSDQNGAKGGSDDIKCVLEARPAGQPPVVVTHRAGSVEASYTGAAEEMNRLLTSRYGKLRHTKGGESIRHLPVD